MEGGEILLFSCHILRYYANNLSGLDCIFGFGVVETFPVHILMTLLEGDRYAGESKWGR